MQNVEFEVEALEQFIWWAHNDGKILDKIHTLLKDISRNGVSKGLGKPEKLKHKPGWSRRITDEHRLVYTVKEQIIYVISCKGHYE